MIRLRHDGRVHERRVVGGQSRVVAGGLDLLEVGGLDDAVLDRDLVLLARAVVGDRQGVGHGSCRLLRFRLDIGGRERVRRRSGTVPPPTGPGLRCGSVRYRTAATAGPRTCATQHAQSSLAHPAHCTTGRAGPCLDTLVAARDGSDAAVSVFRYDCTHMSESTERRPVVVIVNPTAGLGAVRDGARARAEQAAGLCRCHTVQKVEVVVTTQAGHARELAAVGGASTARGWWWRGVATARQRSGRRRWRSRVTVLGVVPAGSGNGLARELHIPLDPRAAFDAAMAGVDRRIDARLTGRPRLRQRGRHGPGCARGAALCGDWSHRRGTGGLRAGGACARCASSSPTT